MKKIKYGRQIGYGLAGLAIGVIVYVMLVADIPSAVEARSSLIEFVTQKEEPTSEYVLDDENYNGEVVPFLKHGGYRISPAQFVQYEKNETVRFGKVNPTFYYVKEILSEDGEQPESELPGQPIQPSDSSGGNSNNKNNNATGGNVIEGFKKFNSIQDK